MNIEGKGGFQRGRSGNPGGRPKEIGEVRDLARQHTPQAIEALQSIMNEQQAPASARVAAAEALLNRGWGKPTQMIAGDEGAGPVELVVRWAGSWRANVRFTPKAAIRPDLPSVRFAPKADIHPNVVSWPSDLRNQVDPFRFEKKPKYRHNKKKMRWIKERYRSIWGVTMKLVPAKGTDTFMK
jgi:hypothetical protein